MCIVRLSDLLPMAEIEREEGGAQVEQHIAG